MAQVIVSAKGDHILIPHKAFLQEPLTSKRQSQHKRRRSSRRSSTFESSDQILRRSSLRHTSQQDCSRCNSKLSFVEATTNQPTVNMPPSPPQTPTPSSVYSRSVMDTPSAPRRRHGRIVPAFRTPRCGEDFARYPRRSRIANVHDLPGRHEGERIAFKHIDAGDNPVYKPSVVSAARKNSAVSPKKIIEKPFSEVTINAVAASFIDAHIAMPCVTNTLCHRLTCGHTVCTATPEVCAKNCTGPHDSGQPRNRETLFECMQCITDHIQDMQYGRLTMFALELADLAKKRNEPSDWIHKKIDLVQAGWRDNDLQEMNDLREKGQGRHCQALWIEPEMQDLVDTSNKASRMPSRTALEQYASPTWLQRPTPEPSTPRSRMSLDVSARNSVSSIATTDSGVPSLRQSVTEIFARRDKKETVATQQNPAVYGQALTTAATTLFIQDDPEAEDVTMEFE